MQTKWMFTVLAAAGWAASACGAESDAAMPDGGVSVGAADTEPSDDDSETDADETGDAEESSGSTGGPIDEDEDEDEDCSFIGCTGGDPPSGECSLWEQDCVEGEKCSPWANDGGNSWNASKCSPLAATPGQPGEPCSVEGSALSGVDSCAVGSMCWDVTDGMGTCAALCDGSPEAPSCDGADELCLVANSGFLPLCLPTCDPLLQDCGEGLGCFGSSSGFACAPDSSGAAMGAYGDGCAFLNACDPSLYCAAAAAVPGCTTTGCCTEFCDLDNPNAGGACGGVAGGQECVPFFPAGAAPPGQENVGFCAIP